LGFDRAFALQIPAFMSVGRFALAVVSLLVGVVCGPVPEARAAPSAAQVLSSPGVKPLRRIGVLVVGGEGRLEAAARDRAGASLEAAGHEAIPLLLSRAAVSRATLLHHSATYQLDAVAVVRISTASSGWTVSVDIRDAVGEPIIAWARRQQADGSFGGDDGHVELVAARYVLPLSEAEVAAAQPEGDDSPAASDAAPAARPRLWVSDSAILYGEARIDGASFYHLVGRPDLEAQYKHNGTVIGATRAVGYVSLGIGVTALALAAFAEGFTQGACVVPNAANSLSDRPSSCGSDSSGLLLVPLALGVAGGLLLATAAAMPRDPLSLEEKRDLARAYNAGQAGDGAASTIGPRPPRPVQLVVSGAPLARGDGGVLLVNGRF
jgi:hypothetical protein